jgi:hypothetical protein
MQNLIITLVFEKNADCLPKIAENYELNIDPMTSFKRKLRNNLRSSITITNSDDFFCTFWT